MISELLHAARNRSVDKREQFCIFVDEFQNFATSDDFSILITEGRKFGLATTIAHQERYDQLEDNKKLLGATAAAANKIFFQLTVKDAQELAPEFAKITEATETKREARLIISPSAVEDIWNRGHPDDARTHSASTAEDMIMRARGKYVWIIEALKNKPQEEYFLFDPNRWGPEYTKQNKGILHVNEFKIGNITAQARLC